MSHHTTETFGARLARLRADRHMTQTDLADAAGVSRSLVCRLEGGTRGSHMPLPTLRALAEALGVPLGVLAGED